LEWRATPPDDGGRDWEEESPATLAAEDVASTRDAIVDLRNVRRLKAVYAMPVSICVKGRGRDRDGSLYFVTRSEK
jgi:hypothetical protein